MKHLFNKVWDEGKGKTVRSRKHGKLKTGVVKNVRVKFGGDIQLSVQTSSGETFFINGIDLTSGTAQVVW